MRKLQRILAPAAALSFYPHPNDLRASWAFIDTSFAKAQPQKEQQGEDASCSALPEKEWNRGAGAR